jgi:hypothetical protein
MEIPCITLNSEVRGGVVGEALGYKPEGSGFESRRGHWNAFIDLILLATLWS